MTTLLLAVIYIAFISLGLPDALLGAAWPSIYPALGAGVSWAGIVTMIISGGTILSSLASTRLIRRFGTGRITAVSVGMTAVALLGFSFAGSFWQLCLWGIPYGLGAGSVDAALNNFVALHYRSRHMSWLHCFWGVGASLGPVVMGWCLTRGMQWRGGYWVIGLLQVGLMVCLLASLPLWRGREEQKTEQAAPLPLQKTLRLPGAKAVLTAFFCYCALESTTGLWAASWLVLAKGVRAETAASFSAMFYLGITAGRFVSGFVSDKLGDMRMVRIGQAVALAGVLCVLAAPGHALALAGLVLIGLGCAPIYPCLLHQTPKNFGSKQSQSLMGLQMACAYVGSTFMPPLFGLIAQNGGVAVYPFYLLSFVLLMALMTERLRREVAGRAA